MFSCIEFWKWCRSTHMFSPDTCTVVVPQCSNRWVHLPRMMWKWMPQPQPQPIPCSWLELELHTRRAGQQQTDMADEDIFAQRLRVRKCQLACFTRLCVAKVSCTVSRKSSAHSTQMEVVRLILRGSGKWWKLWDRNAQLQSCRCVCA